MQYIARLFRFVFSIYGLFAFGFLVVFGYMLYIPYRLIFGHRRDRQYLVFMYRVVGQLVVWSLFLRIEKHYHSKYSRQQGYIVVSNHNAMIDIPGNVIGCPKDILFKFLGKLEAARAPFFGYLIHTFCILVDRKDKDSRKLSYMRMKMELEKGYSIFIYPEGTRNRTTELVQPFYDGAFRLAIETQTPIVVNTLLNTKKLNPPSELFNVSPGKIVSHWEEPVSTEGMTLDDMEVLKEKVKSLMLKRLEEMDN